MLMLALTAQVWKARRISVSQVCVLAWALSSACRTLEWFPIRVPSWGKLIVRWAASGQGLPNVTGTQRSSSCSSAGGRGFTDDPPVHSRGRGGGGRRRLSVRDLGVIRPRGGGRRGFPV